MANQPKIIADCPEPLYRQVMVALRRGMDSGEFTVGSKIPSEEELCELYDVSRITIRRALKELSDEGYIDRRQGKGSFVTMPSDKTELPKVSGFHDDCRRLGKTAGVQVLKMHTATAKPEDAEALRLREGARVVELLRLCSADGVPVIIEIDRFPMVYSYLLECDLSGSLYMLLRGYGTEPGSADHTVGICRANAEQARLLQIAEGTPLMEIYHTVYDQKGRPIHWTRRFIRGDIFPIRI